MNRAQSHVVGVSLMVGVTVLALGGLTMAIGSVVESGASSAEADRVADGMATVADPSEVVGGAEAELRFGDGSLRVENRTMRVIPEGGGDPIRVDSDALVYEVGDYTVVGASNAVLRVASGGATMVSEPSIVADRAASAGGGSSGGSSSGGSSGGTGGSGGSGGNGPSGVLVIGAPAIDGPQLSVSTSGSGTRLGLRTTVEHDRTDLGEQNVTVAVETAHPRPWANYFEDRGATVIDRRRSYPNDRHDSVVAEFDGEPQTYVVVHDAEMEVVYP